MNGDKHLKEDRKHKKLRFSFLLLYVFLFTFAHINVLS